MPSPVQVAQKAAQTQGNQLQRRSAHHRGAALQILIDTLHRQRKSFLLATVPEMPCQKPLNLLEVPFDGRGRKTATLRQPAAILGTQRLRECLASGPHDEL